MKNMILADGRWQGQHGIGRFSHEILSRLNHVTIFTDGPNPLSLSNLIWQMTKLKNDSHQVYYTPGFNPVLFSHLPYVMTVHDLIHLSFPGKFAELKKYYYEFIMKPAIKKASHIITVSEFSKNAIIDWTGIPPEKITVVRNGISQQFSRHGEKHLPGFSYFFHVGNFRAHKNVENMLRAFAKLSFDPALKFILTGERIPTIDLLIKTLNIEERVIFSGKISEEALANYYRGASALIFPSLYEGFGLPVVEAMACGTPVLTSNLTSLPEIAGEAAILVDPFSIDSIRLGMEQILMDQSLRNNLVQLGLERVKLFSWEDSAQKIQAVLDSV